MLALAGGTPRSRRVTVGDEDGTPRAVELVDEAVELIAVTLHRSPGTVRRQLTVARTLIHLPQTTAAVESAVLGVEHAEQIARARQVPYDPDHTMGMRRSAALVDAICGTSTSSTGGIGPGVAVQVTVDLATLAGLADAPALVGTGSGPEPVTADALRELLADPRIPVTFRRLITDPATGQVLDRGRTSYRVPAALREFLIARDGVCRFPGCTRPAQDCDIDHIRSWADGGCTDAANLIPLCRRHHVMKTFGPWRILEHRADGAVVWHAPDGHHVIDLPWRANLPPPPEPPALPHAPSDPDDFPF